MTFSLRTASAALAAVIVSAGLPASADQYGWNSDNHQTADVSLASGDGVDQDDQVAHLGLLSVAGSPISPNTGQIAAAVTDYLEALLVGGVKPSKPQSTR